MGWERHTRDMLKQPPSEGNKQWLVHLHNSSVCHEKVSFFFFFLVVVAD